MLAVMVLRAHYTLDVVAGFFAAFFTAEVTHRLAPFGGCLAEMRPRRYASIGYRSEHQEPVFKLGGRAFVAEAQAGHALRTWMGRARLAISAARIACAITLRQMLAVQMKATECMGWSRLL